MLKQDNGDAQNAAATCGVCGFRPSATAAPPISEDASSSGSNQQAATWLARDAQTLRRVARALKLPGGQLTPSPDPESAALLGTLSNNIGQGFIVLPMWHSDQHLNMTTLPQNPKQRLSETRNCYPACSEAACQLALCPSFAGCSQWMPASPFLHCFAACCAVSHSWTCKHVPVCVPCCLLLSSLGLHSGAFQTDVVTHHA